MEIPRVLVYDHLDNPICELSPNDVYSLERTEEINGQNSLEITTTHRLDRENRILVRDMMGKWREYVVIGVDEQHASGDAMTGTYYCEWSLKHDLEGIIVEDKRPGASSPVAAGVAIEAILSYTRRWSVGDVDLIATAGHTFYWQSAWESLGEIIGVWGGEVRSDISVDAAGVVSRELSLLAKVGQQVEKRRFDYGHDLTSIKRKVEEEPMYCRVFPRGKGEQTDSGAYGRRITIEDANNGVAYIEDADAANALRLPDGLGGYEYPGVVIVNDQIEDPAALKAWAESVLDDYTTPKVTYEGTVEQFAAAGLDAKGVAIGDAIQCVDRGFSAGSGLRVHGRIVKIVIDERDPFGAELTIGHLSRSMTHIIGSIGKTVANTAKAVEAMNGGTMSTSGYIERLIERINVEINAGGGYSYIKPGEGIWVYDKAEDQNPTQVVRVMGGSISIANSKDAQGAWVWQTMLTGRDGILASAVTAARITSGWIGSADANGNWTGSGNYINFDTGEVHLASTATLGSSTISSMIDSKAQIFTSTPEPPYYVGDLWFNSSSSDILTCTTARADGNYAASDWSKRNKYTDDSALTTFLQGDYASDLQAIRGQIDGKAETWYQSADPSTSWTADEKAEHAGDLWYKTTDSTTWRYSGTAWVEQKAPDDVFDKIDGKAQIFTSTPTTPYNVGDLWLNSASSDILTCMTARADGPCRSGDFVKRNKYTDDSALTTFLQGDYASDLQAIRGQIDGKAETWYQSADPSTSWTADEKAEHAGDLWYKTTDSTTWRYSGTAWVEQKAPDDVFDKIDGKAQIFTSQPSPPYNVGDLWFNSSSSDILTCTTARADGNYTTSDWSKRNKYTDDTAVTTLDGSLDQDEIFNRLTSNGTAQGIYLEGGQLYINGNYIKAKTIKTVDLESDGEIISLGKSNVTVDGQVFDYSNTRVVLKNGAIYVQRKINGTWTVVGQLYSVATASGMPECIGMLAKNGTIRLDSKNIIVSHQGNSAQVGTALSCDISIPYVKHVDGSGGRWLQTLTIKILNGLITSISSGARTANADFSKTDIT